MWDLLVPALVALAVAVLAQSIFFDPASRRVRRLKAYLEVRGSLEDASHLADVDVLIAREISTELRARTVGRQLTRARLQLAGWIALVLVFTTGGTLTVIFVESLPGVAFGIATAVAGGAIIAAFNAFGTRTDIVAQLDTVVEFHLTEIYASQAPARELAAEYEIGGGRSELLLRDSNGKIAEVVMATARQEIDPDHLLGRRLWARRLEPAAEFVLLMSRKPPRELFYELKRIGITVAYDTPSGFQRMSRTLGQEDT